jgi:hypothetical protein
VCAVCFKTKEIVHLVARHVLRNQVLFTFYIKEKVNQAEALPLHVLSTVVMINIIVPKKGNNIKIILK